MNLYITADQIGTLTGGGVVTRHESEAFKSIGPCEVWGREKLEREFLGHVVLENTGIAPEPWRLDYIATGRETVSTPEIAHIYSGSFSQTVRMLKEKYGTKVTYTVAAHDKQISKEEHEALGIPFTYPHLTEEGLWQRYIDGYRQSDVIVSPSTVARETIRNYGPEFRDKRIVVIPHGCDLPERTTQFPAQFRVGYLGAYGPDKGVRYLLEAWKKLAYKDAVLMLGGKESTTAGRVLYNAFGGGNVVFMGWVKNISDFYNQLSLYVQPSATEGFGIEVLEAMAHGRPVLCSANAGAVDVVPDGCVFSARNVESLASRIDELYQRKYLREFGWICRQLASHLTWDKVRQKYIDLWRSL